jgi:hypothetical protein
MPRGFPPADIFTAQTPDGGPDGPTDQLCVRAVLAQGSCAYCAGHRHFCARTHTRVPGAFTVEGAPAASRRAFSRPARHRSGNGF